MNTIYTGANYLQLIIYINKRNILGKLKIVFHILEIKFEGH